MIEERRAFSWLPLFDIKKAYIRRQGAAVEIDGEGRGAKGGDPRRNEAQSEGGEEESEGLAGGRGVRERCPSSPELVYMNWGVVMEQ